MLEFAVFYGRWRRLSGRPKPYLSYSLLYFPTGAAALSTIIYRSHGAPWNEKSEDDYDFFPNSLNFWRTIEPQILCPILESQSLSLTSIKILEHLEKVLFPWPSKYCSLMPFPVKFSSRMAKPRTWNSRFTVILSYKRCSWSGYRYIRTFSMPNGECLEMISFI